VKNLLKKLLNYFNSNTKYRIRYFLFWLTEKKYTQESFPLNLKNNVFKHFYINNNKFLIRVYQAPYHVGFFSPSDLNNYIYEIIPFVAKNKFNHIPKDYDATLPMSIDRERQKLRIKYKDKEKKLKNLASNRFHHFYLNKNTAYDFSSDFLSIGKPTIIQTLKKPKINIILFVDGLTHFSNFTNPSIEIKDIMPNTNHFFSDGVHFNSHYSDSEWTLPSTASIFTGNFQQKHKFYHPDTFQVLKNRSTLAENFQKKGYFSFNIGGGWRNSPAYGHAIGADRSLYKKNMPAEEVISHSIDQLTGLKNNNHYIQMSFLDCHHLLGTIPDFSSQLNLSIKDHKVTPWFDPDNKRKSVELGEDRELIEVYKEQIKSLDRKLGTLYNFLKLNYSNDQLYISLISDHGMAFLTSNTNPLCKARTNIPWLLKYPRSSSKVITKLTQNIDIFPTLLKINNIKPFENNTDSVVPSFVSNKKIDRNYALSQSIYPNKCYQCVIRLENLSYFYKTNNKTSSSGFIDLSNGYQFYITNKYEEIIYNAKENLFVKELFLKFIHKWNISN
jgi:hypothetical protein